MQRAGYWFCKKEALLSSLTVDEVNIERVKSARVFGLTVQDNIDNMKWNEHIHSTLYANAAEKVQRVYGTHWLLYILL
jgi:hypothetical protein